MRFRRGLVLFILLGLACRGAVGLSYRPFLESSTAATLSASVQASNNATGAVTLNGTDTRRPTTPFRFDWGDGQTSQGFFPASHTYADRTGNYVASITAVYPDGTSDKVDVVVRFAPSTLRNFPIPADGAVTVPATLPVLTSTQAGATVPVLQAVTDAVLAPQGRAVFERVLGVFALVQRDLVNDDLARVDGSFRQIVAGAPDSASGLAFSVWFTQPVALGAKESAFGADPDWSSFAHELGHNATLNSPASFRLGGKIDGRANAIVSETLAQIFQHVTCHQVVNNATLYGLPDDLTLDLARRARASFVALKSRSGTAPFASWNDPATPEDETLPTFMTLAYQFFAAGDFDGARYRMATKRLMWFLQKFNPSWQTRFSSGANSPAAESFRATLMVAAISYGVEQDLRGRFRGFGFPVDDAIFAELNTTVGAFPGDASRLVNLSVRSRAGAGDNTLAVGFAVGGAGTKQLLIRGIGPTLTLFGVPGTLADPQLRMFDGAAQLLLENNDWGGTGVLASAFAGSGAFGLAATSKDAALLPTLSVGAYSAHVTSAGADGVALVEAYDTDDLAGTARLTNVSARTVVGTRDDVLIAGFVIRGTEPKRLLIRAIGPGLAQFGVRGVLADPELVVFRGTQSIRANDDWGGGAELSATFARVGAFALVSDAKDAALIVELAPGSYTAQVSGVGGTTGVGLVEIYELP